MLERERERDKWVHYFTGLSEENNEEMCMFGGAQEEAKSGWVGAESSVFLGSK